ncbi:hypothetical protein K1719_010847 [Acacia pycnantha]|nr:hypothetical protein K1719_010847 [Acacia pycnantha]
MDAAILAFFSFLTCTKRLGSSDCQIHPHCHFCLAFSVRSLGSSANPLFKHQSYSRFLGILTVVLFYEVYYSVILLLSFSC